MLTYLCKVDPKLCNGAFSLSLSVSPNPNPWGFLPLLKRKVPTWPRPPGIEENVQLGTHKRRSGDGAAIRDADDDDQDFAHTVPYVPLQVHVFASPTPKNSLDSTMFQEPYEVTDHPNT